MNVENYSEFLNEASGFAKMLEGKYGNRVDKCELYHLLAISTMAEPPEFFDFPEDDSIALFIDKKVRQALGLSDNLKM